MSQATKVLLILLPILIFIFLAFLFVSIYLNQIKRNIYNKVFECIKKALGSKAINMYYKNDDLYDIFVETQYSKYYIRILTDTKNKILKVDSDYNYSLQSKNSDKNINDLVRICTNEFNEIDVNKRINKIIVLYPDVSQKIYFKSSVQARFIYSDFEIQNCHILNFSELKDYFEKVEL